MGKLQVHTKFRTENLREEKHLGNVDVHGRIILQWFLPE
jgi:hypothetical protein